MYLIAKNFILFPGLFEIIVQSAYGSAKHYFACTWILPENGCIVTFYTLGTE